MLLFIFISYIFSNLAFGATLHDIIKDKIQKEIPNITINSLSILKPNSIPEDFDKYILTDVVLLSMRNEDGNVKAIYKMPNNLNRSIFFKFKIDATVSVFVSLIDMDKDHILNLNDYKSVQVSLKDFDKDAILNIPKAKLITKTRIKRDKVLTNRQFKTLSDIKRGDTINAIIVDGGLKVEIQVKALEDANIGEIIKVKSDNNQIFKAIIVEKNRAIIR
ncbi:flagellar basal body P-ring formation protein FlgA [Campylobacter hyointestinalis subsp. lawsonii]|uniref:Flagella basal body P-ring formation protein FlgA n=1 Tax=Campylobacter hyointestinalis subsp. lawsonii TaxID=91353 RepID=A0AAV6EFS6_CAMHY|nr:flagellar basal body P-ring formation protein FlgA [Campylobacter hyointestinalis subsp. lawsonii]RAZ29104.1 flagella basal body P-ring formation protein FlgA [Campylobacter hyointestinalis subsp. lawsonii]